MLAPWRRRGVAGTLIRAGLAQAGEAGWQGVFVLGDPEYYNRFGFDAAAASGFVKPYAGPHLMALAPGGGHPPVRSGRIEHAPAFAELG
ncbi:MAG: GNAT family N-acetyltransferase [Alphaproteobacteria bacterium]